jgi:hypothetical protein
MIYEDVYFNELVDYFYGYWNANNLRNRMMRSRMARNKIINTLHLLLPDFTGLTLNSNSSIL